MPQMDRHAGKQHERPFVALIGGNLTLRASLCRASAQSTVHVEPVGAVCDLTLRDLTAADVLLTWNDDGIIAQLQNRLAHLGCWAPVIAIGEYPEIGQVVRAIAAGAIDFVEWTGNFAPLEESIHSAKRARETMPASGEHQIRARELVDRLTPRERQVLLALARGLQNKEIARELRISPRTVEIHRSNMMKKIRARHSADAVRLVIEASLGSNLT